MFKKQAKSIIVAECAPETDGFIFVWKIEDYSMHELSEKCCLLSPIFVTSMFNHSKWRLKLTPFGTLGSNFEIEIEKVGGVSETSVEVSFYLLTSKGPIYLVTINEREFAMNETFMACIQRRELYDIFEDGSVYLTNETLAVKCHLRSSTNLFFPPVFCSGSTQWEVENHSFDHSFHFRDTCPTRLYEKTIVPISEIMPLVKISIQFELMERNYCKVDKLPCTFRILRRDVSTSSSLFKTMNYSECKGKLKINISIFYDRTTLLKNITRMIIFPRERSVNFDMNVRNTELAHIKPCDFPHIFSIHFDLTVTANKFHSNINKCEDSSDMHYNTANRQIVGEISNPENTQIIPRQDIIPKPFQKGFDSLLDDLNLLLTENKFCDVTLKIGGKKFPAHKNILSARSSVFCTMFQSHMKEKETGVVDIEDIDAETFEHFLKYLYLGKLDKLTEETAIPLYSAADKYHVTSLKNECSSYILDHLREENVCDILILSDMHQDEELKNAAQKTFCIYSKSVLLSRDWATVSQERPELAIETLQKVALNMK